MRTRFSVAGTTAGAAAALFLTLAGCGDKPKPRAAVTQDAAASVLASEVSPAQDGAADCTLETKLVPGVPGSPGHYIGSEINPNGHSELANRMRLMLADLRKTRDALVAGGTAEALPLADHTRIRCSWPTTAADRNPTTDGMAVGYLQRVEAFNEKRDGAAFDAVIDGCVTCHMETCQGPLAAIEPLRLPGEAP